MPWIRTVNTIPPKDTELQLYNKGKRWKGKLDVFDIVNGLGMVNPDIPEYWSNLTDPDLPDPEPFKLKGIDHTMDTESVIDESIAPKLDSEGKAPHISADVMGHDGFAKE